MRVVHVISDLDPAAGGPPMVVSRLAAAQADQGHDVHLVIYDTPAANEHIDNDLRAIPGGTKLKLHRVAEPSHIEWMLSTDARRHMQGLAQQADVFHLHGIWDPILRAGSVVARQFKKPYVVAPHGMLDVWALSEKPLKKKIALALGYRRMITSASLLHALSDYERTCILDTKLNPRVDIIPNGVFLDEFSPMPPKGTYYAAHPELQGQPYILFLARLHEVKGLDLLADALALILPDLPATRLVVAGPDFGARDALLAQVRRLGIADRVHLVGPQYAKDKVAALADAACFALPSKHEGFSMSIAEAMACSLPVVITDTCHFPDAAAVEAGRVVPRQVPAIATALREVLSNAALSKRMGEAGRALIEERYTWPKVAERSIGLYSKLGPPGKPMAI